MIFRAVGDKCAVDLKSLNLPIAEGEALAILKQEGFWIKKVELAPLMERFIGRASYRRGARMSEAPQVFDCSSFVKWIYGFLGINLPRRSVQQFEVCEWKLKYIRGLETYLSIGDLVFSRGIKSYIGERGEFIGHVGIISDIDYKKKNFNVIHALNAEKGIVKENFHNEFLSRQEPNNVWLGKISLVSICDLLILVTPPKWEVETSDDIRWIILQKLPYR
jgi:hypothetical protein